MNIIFISDKLGFDDLRMASFNGSKYSFVVNFIEFLVFDLIPELLSDVIKTGVDLCLLEMYFSRSWFVDGEHSSIELLIEDLVVVWGADDFHDISVY